MKQFEQLLHRCSGVGTSKLYRRTENMYIVTPHLCTAVQLVVMMQCLKRQSFCDGLHLGQWCEAMHIHMKLIHIFLPHTKPPQTQLHLKVKRPEQVFLRRAFLLVFLCLQALCSGSVSVYVCVCVCVCVCCIYKNQKKILLFRKASLDASAPEMRHSLSLDAQMMRQIFFSCLSRQPLLESCLTVQRKVVAASWLPCSKRIAHEIQNLLSFRQTRAWQFVLRDTGKQVLL